MIFNDFEYYRNHPMFERIFKKHLLKHIGEEKKFTFSLYFAQLYLVVHNNTMFVEPNETMEDRKVRLMRIPHSKIEKAAETILFPYIADEIDLYEELMRG